MIEFIDAAAVAQRCSATAATDALEAALRGSLDPEAGPPRSILPAGAGELLVMPSAAAGAVAVKLVTVGGDPRIQGVCVVFDPHTLAPAAVIDGIALTNLRTAAVSMLALRHLAPAGANRAVVFGRGPQGRAHAAALREVIGIEEITVIATPGSGVAVARQRTWDSAAEARGAPHDMTPALQAADVVCCCTTSREPLFDGALVRDGAAVVAIGSHEPDARETDDALASRSTVVVESRASALREAGDVIAPIASGALREDDLVTLRDLVTGAAAPDPGRPRLFKSTGMAWEDAVVAAAIVG